jgi:DNA-binding winged helix-turn-helix (wHTH) protein
MQIGRARVDLRRFQIHHGTEVVRLSVQEVALLKVFIAAAQPADSGGLQAIVSRDTLFRDGLGYRSADHSRALDYAIRRLRTKLGDDTTGRAALQTVRGQGYRLAWTPTAPTTPAGPVLVGRADWLERIQDTLAAGEICTLIGPPGVGKTHLARCWAAETGGVRWLEAAGEAPDSSAVVLDHCETALADARATASRVVARGGSVVCTSRRRLGLPEERVLDVPPLPRPDAASLLRLSLTRVGAPVPAEPLLHALCEVCDDLPLAIVLLAPRLRSLPPERVLQRLAHDVESEDGLEACVQTALAGLSPAARTTLARCAQTEGILSLEVLEGLAPPGSDGLAVVEELVDHSVLLVDQVSGPGLRYRLLRPLRRVLRSTQAP